MFKKGETVEFRIAYDEWRTATYIDELKNGGHLVESNSRLFISFDTKKINTIDGVKPGQPILVWAEFDDEKSIDIFVELNPDGLVDCEKYMWDHAEKLPNYNYDSEPLDMTVK